jgi:prepilin-type N-terminal cleavage/methylation domain-containing protein
MRNQKGFSLIELLIVIAIILVIAAVAIPSLLRSRLAANDAAAGASIRTLNTAEIAYQSAYPTEGYSPSLRRLGPNGSNCTGAVDFRHACLVDSELGCLTAAGPCPKSGYNYFITSSATAAPFSDYVVAAGPISWGLSGSANWCSLADGVVRSSQSVAIPPVASITASPDVSGCQDPTAFLPLSP